MPQIIKVGYGWSQTQFTSSIAYSNTLEARYGESHGSPYVQIATDCGTDWVSGFNISVAYRTIPKGTTGGWGTWSGFYWSGVKASECWHGTEPYSSRHLWSFPLGDVGLTPTGSDPGPSIGSLVCPNGWGFDVRGNDAMEFQIHVRIVYPSGKKDQNGNSTSGLVECGSALYYYVPKYTLTSLDLDRNGLDVRYTVTDWSRPDDRWGLDSVRQDNHDLVVPNGDVYVTYGTIDQPGYVHVPATAFTRMPDGGNVSITFRIVASFCPNNYNWCIFSQSINLVSQLDCNTPTLSLRAADTDGATFNTGDSGDKGVPIETVHVKAVGSSDVDSVPVGDVAVVLLPPLGKPFRVQAWGTSESGAMSDYVYVDVPAIEADNIDGSIAISPIDGEMGVLCRFNLVEKWDWQQEATTVKFAGRSRESVAYGIGGTATGSIECDVIDRLVVEEGEPRYVHSQDPTEFENLAFAGPCVMRDSSGHRRYVYVEGVGQSWDRDRFVKRMTISLREVS